MIRTAICLAAIVLLIGMALVDAPARGADQTSTWNGGNGDWDDPIMWNTNPLYPDNGNGGFTYDAIVNSGSVTVDLDVTIEAFTLAGSLTVQGPSVSFTANGSTTLDGCSLYASSAGAVDVSNATGYVAGINTRHRQRV